MILLPSPTIFTSSYYLRRSHSSFHFNSKMSGELEPVVDAVEFLHLVPPIGEDLSIAGHFQARNNVSTCFSALPTDFAAEAIDITDKAPQDNSYDTLKRTVISRLSHSQEKRVQPLLFLVELGDRTPSQLLRHMRSLLGETRAVGTPILNRVTTQQSDVLTKLFEKVELLVPNISSQSDNKQRPRFPKQSDSAPKHRNRICYHHRMYGDDAKKCQPACKYSKTGTITSQGNFAGSNAALSPILQKLLSLIHRPGSASDKQPLFQSPYISLC
ncbi:unnamed protein product [Hymenolepis diminuta]|uniref:Uncharacterized protein n=1 Tax=Hymenolepis diminuta TaxID=6216 RepID=A0A564YCR3_HYMDI|nr:unnamed protein product [Hymenolepis diminuta]